MLFKNLAALFCTCLIAYILVCLVGSHTVHRYSTKGLTVFEYAAALARLVQSFFILRLLFPTNYIVNMTVQG